MTFVDAHGAPLSLVLYKFDACPYCVRVTDWAAKRGWQLPMRDTREDPAARAELVRVGGKSQVPCLFVNGKPMYESLDIIAFLETVRAT